jgi:hypothetical protein
MNKIMKLLAICILVFLAPMVFACDYPAPPRELPDGTSADIEAMKVGVAKIAAYQEEMNEYLSCIEAEEVVAIQALADDEDAKKQRKTMFDKKFNAAVDEQTRAVEQFNAEIRAYKERS